MYVARKKREDHLDTFIEKISTAIANKKMWIFYNLRKEKSFYYF